MVRGKQMTLTEKAKIIALAEQNVSNREIAVKTNFNESSVRRFLKKYRETDKLERKKGSGRKKCTNERENRIIMKSSLQDRFKNAVEIASEVQQRFDKQISARTIQRRLKEMGLMARTPAKKPLLNKRMKKARLNWAKNKQNWGESEWSRIIFSDESKFNLIGPDGCLTVRRRNGERYSEECCVATVKHSPYVMVWGCISRFKTESLIMLQGMVNAEKYKEIILSGLVPSIESLSENIKEPIFQDDSAPCHRARCVSGF